MTKLLRSLFILLFFLGLCRPANAGVTRIGRFFDNATLRADDYTGFCQDNDGFVWIGTSRGLIRFDGNSYDIYRHDDAQEGSLSDSRVLGLLSDHKGRLWVATANGLNLYNSFDDKFRVIPLPSEDFYGYIIGLSEQKDGTVTFVVSGVGLYVVDDSSENPTAVIYNWGQMDRLYTEIVCCQNGRIYIGSHDGTIYCMAPNGKITTIKATDGSYVRCLAREEDDNVLIGTLHDIYRLRADGSVVKLTTEQEIAINDMSNCAGGRVYVTTTDAGIWEIPTKSETVNKCAQFYCNSLNFENTKLGAIYNAPSGDLWIGCDYKGVVLMPGVHDPFLYRSYTDAFPDFRGGADALAEWNGYSVAALDKGRIAMFGTGGKVLMQTTIPGADKITDIQMIGSDKAFVSVANEGVWEMSLPSGAIRKVLNVDGNYPTIVTAPGKEDELFVGIHGGGLMRYNLKTGQQTWIPYDPEGNQLTNPYITSLNHTPDDKIWIGLYGGIACYDLKTDRLLSLDQDPFLVGATFAIVPCMSDNSVWVGTSHGLIHYDPDKGILKKFTTADGLSDNDVRSIARDHNGGKWIGTMRGLSYLSPDNGKIVSYYGGYGLVETAFNQVKFSPSRQGMYLGSDLGITAFKPDAVPAPGFDREVKVSAMYLNGHKVLPSMKAGRKEMIEGNPMSSEELRLPYKNNALALRLSTMDFRDASNVHYKWRLSKRDNWIETSPGENMLYLPHLDPGKYTLEICAVENNAESPATEIQIKVAQPWYWTGLAKIIYLFVLISFITLAYIVVKKRREEKVSEDKIKFFMDVSHDLRSPMTLIMSPLENLMKEQTDPSVKVKLNVMHRNAQRVMNLVNRLLDIQKFEKGKMQLNCSRTEVTPFVEELVDIYRQQTEEKKQTLQLTASDDIGEIWLDRDNFDKIMVNLITNAIKYTPAGGKIEVSLAKTDDETLGKCLDVTITDTGVGLDPKELSMLFEPFYRMHESINPSTKGFGIGLDLCRRLVELHHGRISAANRTDGIRGSVFRVLIPLDLSRYKEEELSGRISEEKETSGRPNIRSVMPTAGVMPKPKPMSAGGKVLVVDDDDELCGYVASMLGKYYRVKQASDGNGAMKLISDWKPDIVVSDVMMPGMDGLTLLKRLKSNADTNHIPVVLLSSKVSLADRMEGWDKGADGYLGKPFNIEELEALVDTLIENRRRMKGKYSGAQETEGKIEGPTMKGNDEALMERIVKEINAHIDDPDLNVEELASQVGVSRAHLHRKMKDLIGMTPSDYIRNIRLKRACELLKRQDIEITQVAYKIGFVSQSHFSSHFKRYTGYSPTEYRAKCQAGEIPEMK